MKKQYNNKSEQSLDYRIEKLKDFSYEIPDDLETMTDIRFNDLLARFEDQKKRDDEALLKKNQRREKFLKQKADKKLELERQTQEETERKKLEEESRLEQARREKENFEKEQSAKLEREKIFEEQRKKIPEPVNEFEEEDIDKPKKKRMRFLQ